jgi:hypothetical protein
MRRAKLTRYAVTLALAAAAVIAGGAARPLDWPWP